MAEDLATPEYQARKALYDLLVVKVAERGPDFATVYFGWPPDEDADTYMIWVGAVQSVESYHGMRGPQGPSVRMTFAVDVHVAAEDSTATAEEISEACFARLAFVRDVIRAAIATKHPFGDGVRNPEVVGTESSGPVPLPTGGHVEQAQLEVQFIATI